MHSFRVYWMSLYMFQTVSFPHQLKSQNPDTVRTVNVSSVTTLNLRQLMSYVYMEHPFLMYLDHTQRRTTVGRTPLDEWSARRRDFYLTTHDTHNRQISMPPGGIRTQISAGERPLTCWDRGFESHRGHGYLSVVSVVCCQAEVSATSWSLVERIPTDCGASLCVI